MVLTTRHGQMVRGTHPTLASSPLMTSSAGVCCRISTGETLTNFAIFLTDIIMSH